MDINKSKTTTVNLNKQSNVVKNDVAKETLFDELVKKVEALQAIDSSELVKKAHYRRNIEDIEKK